MTALVRPLDGPHCLLHPPLLLASGEGVRWPGEGAEDRRLSIRRNWAPGSTALVSHFRYKPQFPQLSSGVNTYLARFL